MYTFTEHNLAVGSQFRTAISHLLEDSLSGFITLPEILIAHRFIQQAAIYLPHKIIYTAGFLRSGGKAPVSFGTE